MKHRSKCTKELVSVFFPLSVAFGLPAFKLCKVNSRLCFVLSKYMV